MQPCALPNGLGRDQTSKKTITLDMANAPKKDFAVCSSAMHITTLVQLHAQAKTTQKSAGLLGYQNECFFPGQTSITFNQTLRCT